MFRSIIPREEVFFDNFENICALMTEAAMALRAMLETGGPYAEAARRIKEIEAQADKLTHHSIEKLHKTFVTPLDRQDILRLAVGLDDILDTTEAVSSLLDLYNPRETMQEALRLSDLLVQGTEKVAAMVGLLRHLSKQTDRIMALAVELNQLENDADQAYQQAVARLFQEEDDPKELIKWKDILEHIEAATDRCEDVSDIIDIAFDGRRHSRVDHPHHYRGHHRGGRHHQVVGRQMGGGLPDRVGLDPDHPRHCHRRGLDVVSAASSTPAGEIGFGTRKRGNQDDRY